MNLQGLTIELIIILICIVILGVISGVFFCFKLMKKQKERTDKMVKLESEQENIKDDMKEVKNDIKEVRQDIKELIRRG